MNKKFFFMFFFVSIFSSNYIIAQTRSDTIYLGCVNISDSLVKYIDVGLIDQGNILFCIDLINQLDSIEIYSITGSSGGMYAVDDYKKKLLNKESSSVLFYFQTKTHNGPFFKPLTVLYFDKNKNKKIYPIALKGNIK
ncbi:MAG TPA: hypothetical protein PKO18_04750 [Chitinophagales bacterium]|nr:hypothetical protein [Chitinophagales bacterium]